MAFDARDKEIALDSHVRYVDTGTIGKVLDIKTTDGVDWVRIDKTDLWYRASLVEVLDDKDLNKRFDSGGDDKRKSRKTGKHANGFQRCRRWGLNPPYLFLFF